MEEMIVKKDNMYFIDIEGLSSFGIQMAASSYNDSDYQAVDCDAEGVGYKEDDKGKNILYVVKYLGSGIFEEMLTGIKIIGAGYAKYEDNGEEVLPKFCALKYEDYISENSENGLVGYVHDLNSIKKVVNNYPIAIGENDYLCDFNDDNKKIYLQIRDQERIGKLQSALKVAQDNAKDVCELIDAEIEKVSKITTELLDEAYFDNQVFDFAAKGKSK